MCPVHNVKKILKKVLEGTVSLPGKYSKLSEETRLGYGEEQIDLGVYTIYSYAYVSVPYVPP
jgi:hypothetical protein